MLNQSFVQILYIDNEKSPLCACLGRYSELSSSNVNYRTFIGYCGETGQQIAEDLCGCLRTYGVYALAITPNIHEAIPYLESEEQVLRIIGSFDAVIMVCTRRTYSRRFIHEAEKAIYDLNMPTIAFISKRSSVLESLKRCTRVRFERGQHLANCERLAEIVRLKVDQRRGVTIQPL